MKRNAMVITALAAGMTQQDVARVTGLGRARISQIVKARKEGLAPLATAKPVTHEELSVYPEFGGGART